MNCGEYFGKEKGQSIDKQKIGINKSEPIKEIAIQKQFKTSRVPLGRLSDARNLGSNPETKISLSTKITT
ncbi:MAG: hypothetical protein ACJA1C_001043 [Crocinitomicaceae bacterium]|jgi:hypothetical protein